MKINEVFNSKFEKFILKYGRLYDSRILKYIKINFNKYLNSDFTPDVLMQIYSYLDIRNDLVYLEHLDKIQKYFDIKCNILEVGCGYLPAFATLLSSRQLELGCGTVTAYDPKLVTLNPKNSNMVLCKESFGEDVIVKDFDLIVGLYPCAATEDILKSACMNQKNFYLAMCGCPDPKFPYDTLDFYTDFVLELAEYLVNKYDNGVLCYDRVSEKFSGVDYPILYNKKS